jgi:hypothetical protein
LALSEGVVGSAQPFCTPCNASFHLFICVNTGQKIQ